MGSPLIWGGTNGLGILLPANAAGILTTDASGDIGISPSAAAGYAQAQHDGGYIWTTTSLSFADPTNTSAGTFSVLTSSGLTLTAASGTLPGITFTPVSASVSYLIVATVHLFNATSNAGTAIRLYDGTTVIETTGGSGNAAAVDAVTVFGIYSPGSTSAKTVKLQFAVLGGGGTSTTTIGNVYGGSTSVEVSIAWTVISLGGVSGGSTGGGVTIANVGARVALGV